MTDPIKRMYREAFADKTPRRRPPSQQRREAARFKIAIEALKRVSREMYDKQGMGWAHSSHAKEIAETALDKLGIKWRE